MTLNVTPTSPWAWQPLTCLWVLLSEVGGKGQVEREWAHQVVRDQQIFKFHLWFVQLVGKEVQPQEVTHSSEAPALKCHARGTAFLQWLCKKPQMSWESTRPFELPWQGSVNALFSQDTSKLFCVGQPLAALGWEWD